MASELQGNATASNTGLTTYFVVWNATGQVRLTGGATFGTASAVNRNAGAISATELGTASGVYAADAPAFAAGTYSYALYQRLGGSPAESDTLLAGPGDLSWNGSAAVGAGAGAMDAYYATNGAMASNVTLWRGSTPNALANGLVSVDGAAVATAWGARVLGDGRTADMYLQGLMNRLEFSADGLTFTLYSTDDVTPLATGPATRLGPTIGGLRGINPS